MEDQLRLLHEANDEKKAKESKKYRDEITNIEEELQRQDDLLIAEYSKHVVIQGETMKANENRLKDSLTAFENADDFL